MHDDDWERAQEEKFDLLHDEGLLPKRHYPLRLLDIHIGAGWAFIQGETTRSFSDLEALLTHIGCKVEKHRVEVTKVSDTQVAHQKYNVEFPAGSYHTKHPKDTSNTRTASGRRRRGAKAEDVKKVTWSLNARKGQIVVPGAETDYIVTYYQKSETTPELFDRGVHEVEKG